MKKMVIGAILVTLISCSIVAVKINSIKEDTREEIKIEQAEASVQNSEIVVEESSMKVITKDTVSEPQNIRETNFQYIKYTMALLAVGFVVVTMYEVSYAR